MQKKFAAAFLLILMISACANSSGSNSADGSMMSAYQDLLSREGDEKSAEVYQADLTGMFAKLYLPYRGMALILIRGRHYTHPQNTSWEKGN